MSRLLAAFITLISTHLCMQKCKYAFELLTSDGDYAQLITVEQNMGSVVLQLAIRPMMASFHC